MGSATSVPNARELLAEFKTTGDQHAFEEIVRRYAGMVFGVCLRTTKNTHDAEDATQAVFLSLAAQCKTGDGVRYVGPWLQQVAKRVSLDIKRSRKRRETREHRHHAMNGGGNGNGHTEVDKSGAAVDVDELKGVLGEELSQLPAKYRLPLILHYFGGLSRDEMAKELNCKPATLGVRIHRGREMLGRRLHERGAAPQGLMLSALLAGTIKKGVSDALVARTCEAVAKMGLGQDLGTLISAQVLAISKTAASGAALAVKLKAVAAVLLVALLTLTAGTAVAKLAPLDMRLPDLFKRNWVPKFRAPVPRPTFTENTPAAPAVDPDRPADAAPAVHVVQSLPDPAPRTRKPQDRANARPAPQPLNVASVPAGTSGAALPPAARSSAASAAVPDHSTTDHAAIASARAAYDLPPVADAPRFAPGALSLPGGQFAVGDVKVGRVGAMPPIVPVPGLDAVPVPDGDGTSLSVAGAPGSTGQFRLNGGNMEYDVQDVGARGAGTFDQVGGTNTATQLALGRDHGGDGRLSVRDGGRLQIRPAPAGASGILVGGRGRGRIDLGDADSTGSIHGIGGAGPGEPPSLVVRGDDAGSGVIEGAGTVNLPGTLLNNGAAIADGHGQGRTLDFYGFGKVTNSIENPAVGGTQGWYAKAGGRLALPPISVSAGTGTYTWGEDAADPVLDLVNSARLTLRDAPAAGSLKVSLLALDRGGVPPLPRGHTFIGVWQADLVALGHDPATGAVTADPMTPGGVDLVVRYDDALAAKLGLDENHLKLWKYADGKWTRILDGFERHPDLNLLVGRTDGDLGYFAVSAPEPAAGALLLLASGYLLTRRRPRKN